jgi:predicted PurR-regulated permease PerM
MLGLDRRAACYTWTAALIIILLLTLYLIRSTLFVFVVALLFAYLLSPLVDFLDRVLPTSRTRTPALVVAYLILVGLLVFGGIELGTRVVEQANALVKRLPDLIGRAIGAGPMPTGPRSLTESVLGDLQSQIRQHANDIVAYLPKAGMTALSIVGNMIFVVVVPILSFFFLKDGRSMRQQILDLFEDSPRRDLLEDVARDVNILLIQYMRALLILSLATFTAFSVFFSFTGVPYPLLLAGFAALLEFIPVVGPLAAAVTILLVAGVSGYGNIMWILVFLGLYRIFQDYILSPRLLSAGVELHPLLVIFGVFAGGEIGGVPGTFLSVPTLALARVLYRRLQKTRRAADVSEAVTEP